MQKLLLELGGPLVFAFVLLGLARFVRRIVKRFRKPGEGGSGEYLSADFDGAEHPESDDDSGTNQKRTN